MKRIFLGLLLIISAGWIAFFAVDLISLKNNLSPEDLFGQEDSTLLIINRQNEISLSAIDGFDGTAIQEIYSGLRDSAYDAAFLSTGREHALFIRKKGWNKEEIFRLFDKRSIKEYNPSDNTFTIGKFKAKFYKQGLYLYHEGLNYDKTIGKLPDYDKKASASLFEFSKNGSTAVTDIYFKQNGRYDFKSYNSGIKQGKQIRDEELFASYISDKITSYHFHERDYYAATDTIFAKSPMYQWMDKGFVELTIDNKKAIISDYVTGQDPLLILADLEQADSLGLYSTKLLKDFPGAEPYYVDYLEDLVVISRKKEICDLLIAEYKLGHTIALNTKRREKIFLNLPQLVSERLVDDNITISKSFYNGYTLTTKADLDIQSDHSKSKKNISVNVGANIKDFAVLKGDGNIVTIDNSNSLNFYNAGKKTWSKVIEGLSGNLQLVDIYANGQEHIMVRTEDEIHLYEQNGESVSGFPVKLDKEISNELNFYRWKSQGFLIVCSVDGKAYVYDTHGRERDVINPGITGKQQTDIWTSQGRLFYGFCDNSNFVMYDADRDRIHRKFQVNGPTKSARIPNELLHFKLQNEQLIRIDQKGNLTSLDNYPGGKIIHVEDGNKNPVIVVKSLNELKFINSQGLLFSSIRLPFNEINYVDLVTTGNGKTVVAVIDGLENNVYLYSLDGSKLSERPLEGQLKVVISESAGTYKITTVVDQFIVQYFEN